MATDLQSMHLRVVSQSCEGRVFSRVEVLGPCRSEHGLISWNGAEEIVHTDWEYWGSSALCTVVLTQCQFAEMDSVQLCAIRAGEEPHRHTDLGNLQNSIPEGKDQHQAHQQVTCEEKELSFSNQYKNECSDCQQANLNLSVKGGGELFYTYLWISL